ncbi:MAG: hypothetical protein RBS02_01255 [Steroidobacteraceae bacterium]|jgi:hypothetical protein|nr:hypothetical protein [Steroidobacteraceae bacterium]
MGAEQNAMRPSSMQRATNFARGSLMGVTTDMLGAPVDLATTVMRPFGYDVERPIGSSDWIAEKLGFAPSGDAAKMGGRMLTGLLTPGGLAKGASLAASLLAAKLSPAARTAAELARAS